MTDRVIVCLNKPQNSVCFVMKEPEEIDNYLFLEEKMELIEMPTVDNSYDLDTYMDYFVVDGEWVHRDDIDLESISPDTPVRRK